MPQPLDKLAREEDETEDDEREVLDVDPVGEMLLDLDIWPPRRNTARPHPVCLHTHRPTAPPPHCPIDTLPITEELRICSTLLSSSFDLVLFCFAFV